LKDAETEQAAKHRPAARPADHRQVFHEAANHKIAEKIRVCGPESVVSPHTGRPFNHDDDVDHSSSSKYNSSC
jgi:hypothetical protein